MKNRDLIRDAMMFAVKDITGRVLREATVQSMIDDFEKELNILVVVHSGFYCMNAENSNGSCHCPKQCNSCVGY